MFAVQSLYSVQVIELHLLVSSGRMLIECTCIKAVGNTIPYTWKFY